MATKIVVGVWKDRLTVAQSARVTHELVPRVQPGSTVLGVAPAPVAFTTVRRAAAGTPLEIVSHDVHWPAESGSYIGTTSLAMLKELNVRYCMVGHSERRRFFCESNDDVLRKMLGCQQASIIPILCVGDAEDDLHARQSVLTGQLAGSLRGEGSHNLDLRHVAIAYEPVWAISTWRSERPLPTGSEVRGMLELVREIAREVCAEDLPETPFLFGGSVGPANAEEYFAEDGVDGALVGGASLTADTLVTVFGAARAAWG